MILMIIDVSATTGKMSSRTAKITLKMQCAAFILNLKLIYLKLRLQYVLNSLKCYFMVLNTEF